MPAGFTVAEMISGLKRTESLTRRAE